MEKLFNIATVERETGLTRETLRIWERRYGFPNPARDATGDRAFNAQEVERLLHIKRLLEMGYRPGRVVPLSMPDLLRLEAPATKAGKKTVSKTDPHLAEYVRLLGQNHVEELRLGLDQALLRLGLSRLILEVIAPLTEQVGEAWLRGEIGVRNEHAYTELVGKLLRRAVDRLPRGNAGPRILMTTPAGELHGLGLLMAECLLILEGAECHSLGVNLPNNEIAAAARDYQAQVVALSISPAYPRRMIGGSLDALRSLLDPHVEIWAGGLALQHLRLPPGVSRCVKLEGISELVADWRRRQAGG